MERIESAASTLVRRLARLSGPLGAWAGADTHVSQIALARGLLNEKLIAEHIYFQ